MPPQRQPQRGGRGRGDDRQGGGGGYRGGGGGGGRGRGDDRQGGYRGGGGGDRGGGYQDDRRGGYRGGGGDGGGRDRGYHDDRQGGGGGFHRGGGGRGRGFGPPRGRQDRGGYGGGRGASQQSFGSREWNPFPEGPGSHPVKKIYTPEDLGIKVKMSLRPSSSGLPRRPGEGQLGKKIQLVSNNFAMKAPSGCVYHYDVDIFSTRSGQSTATGKDAAPAKYICLKTKRNREVVHHMLTNNPVFEGAYGAYDGKKNLFCRIPLNIEKGVLKCKVELPRRDEPPDAEEVLDVFEVLVKPVTKKDSSDCSINLDSLHELYAGVTSEASEESVMAIETILRNGPCLRFTPVGRSFFYPPLKEHINPLGGGLEVWFGYHQSVRLGQWSPIVNLNLTATAFHQAKEMIECMAEVIYTNTESLRRGHIFDNKEIYKINKYFKNLEIEATHFKTYKRKHKFLRLTNKPANTMEFTIKENGKEVRKTVQRFFKEQHNIDLQFPHLPCIHVHPETKTIYYPIEVCNLMAGQHYKKKLDGEQTAQMIKVTARPPSDRFHAIKDIRDNKADYNGDELVSGYEMSIYKEPLQLGARVLNVPGVLYKDCQGEKKVTPYNGAWDMKETQYYRPAKVNSWVILNFSKPRFCGGEALGRFVDMLLKVTAVEGITHQVAENRYVEGIGRPASVETLRHPQQSVEAALRNAQRKYSAELAIVVVPNGSKQIYNEVKLAAETVLGIATQCIVDGNVVKKCSLQLVSNLCQKINAKMGGVNNSLITGELPAVMREPIMIIGADVTHSSPTSDKNADSGISIAAVTASLDRHPSRYSVRLRAQINRDENKKAVEIILDLQNMVEELLSDFYNHTRKKPCRIIVYRDGVSEGEFYQVRQHEIDAIRRACKAKQRDGYEPPITFIVVQKRHHTRFMPKDPRDGAGKMKNIPPGTTVDTVVTHPLNFDFYLCSHLGIQGTSRPCRYTVLHDDNAFSADDLQKLTFYLCHTYARCTRSISSPAPVMYADLAAYRASKYVSDEDMSSASSTSSKSSETKRKEAEKRLEQVQKEIKIIETMADSMFYV